jgi:hypothetical protein
MQLCSLDLIKADLLCFTLRDCNSIEIHRVEIINVWRYPKSVIFGAFVLLVPWILKFVNNFETRAVSASVLNFYTSHIIIYFLLTWRICTKSLRDLMRELIYCIDLLIRWLIFAWAGYFIDAFIDRWIFRTDQVLIKVLECCQLLLLPGRMPHRGQKQQIEEKCSIARMSAWERTQYYWLMLAHYYTIKRIREKLRVACGELLQLSYMSSQIV